MLNMLLRRIRLSPSLGRCLISNNSYDLAIAELNKEMESIFGEPPPDSLSPSANQMDRGPGTPPLHVSTPNTPENQHSPSNVSDKSSINLTHVDSSGQARMVDASSKQESRRTAIASCRVLLGQQVFNLVASNQIAKGDALTVAKITGINGAKQTSNLIPLCHNINLSHIRVDLKLNEKDFSVDIEGEATTTEKTGVEMEALAAVSIAGLTVYDMCKAASKEICITDVRLEQKTGGKSGSWSRNK